MEKYEILGGIKKIIVEKISEHINHDLMIIPSRRITKKYLSNLPIFVPILFQTISDRADGVAHPPIGPIFLNYLTVKSELNWCRGLNRTHLSIINHFQYNFIKVI